MKLLVIEDDKGLANGIAFSMERDGNEVFTAGTLKKGRELFEEKEPDAILLDLNLPDGDGIDFCRSIREISQVPVLMLTARDMETDEVQGLLSGADDYLTKPFSLAVLKARLDTVLRRSRMRTLENAGQAGSMAGMPGSGQAGSMAEMPGSGQAGSMAGMPGSGQAGSMTGMPGSGPHGPGACAEEMDTENALVSGDIRLVPGRMKVYCRGQEVECSATEYRLLYYLMENRGQVLLKEQILEHVWDSTGSYVDENTLQVTVRRLRRKLETNPSSPKYIRTVHGMGYIFAEGIGETR